MAESVADLLRRLRFVGGPVEMLYLNKTRVHDNFNSNVGEIESFTRTAAQEIKGQTPVVQVGAGLSREGSVTWTLKDPITQALVLRDTLKSNGSLHGLDSAGPGRYITFAGEGIISRPGLFDAMHREALREHPGLYDSLEAERTTRDELISVTEPPGRLHHLLTVSDGPSVCAAILDEQWLQPTWPDWIGRDYRYEILGLFRRDHEPGIPMLATLYVGVKW
jgi:hypothetical protein